MVRAFTITALESCMGHDDQTTVTGEVTDVFAHRFVVKTTKGKILADLGPKGAERVTVRESDRVELSGEMKPSELKVHRITMAGAQPITIEHKKPKPDEHKEPKPHEHEKPKPHDGQHHEPSEADPAPALETVAANGFTVLGSPRRKPKHFEILGRDRAGDLVELHIDLDGTLRKTRPVTAEDGKWAAEIGGAA